MKKPTISEKDWHTSYFFYIFSWFPEKYENCFYNCSALQQHNGEYTLTFATTITWHLVQRFIIKKKTLILLISLCSMWSKSLFFCSSQKICWSIHFLISPTRNLLHSNQPVLVFKHAELLWVLLQELAQRISGACVAVDS